MGKSFLSKKELVLGIDIGSHSVKVCQLRKTSAGFDIVALGSAILPEDAVDDGNLLDPEGVGEVISTLIKNLKIKNKKIGFSISGYSVIVKKIKLPVMEDTELEEHIQAEAEQYIPFDIEDVYLDYQDLQTAGDTGNTTDVVLVAAKKEVVDEYLEMFKNIGLKPVIVDADTFAFENSYQRIHGKGENVALVDIGASNMNINLLRSGISVVSRDVVVGSGQLTEQIQNILDIEAADADKIKIGALPVKTDLHEIEEVYSTVCSQWILEINKALDLYHANNEKHPLRKMFLGGGGAKIAGLADLITQKTGMEVTLAEPFAGMGRHQKKIDPQYLQAIEPEMAVACGIALRESEL